MNLKKKILVKLILTILLLCTVTGSVQAASLFDNVTVRSTNVFSMQTLGASTGDTFTSPVTINGTNYTLTYKITGTNTVEVSDCVQTIIGDLIIPNTVTYEGTEYTITRIGDWAFHSCSKLTSVVIPKEVTSIGSYAFYFCSSLKNVEIKIKEIEKLHEHDEDCLKKHYHTNDCICGCGGDNEVEEVCGGYIGGTYIEGYIYHVCEECGQNYGPCPYEDHGECEMGINATYCTATILKECEAVHSDDDGIN